MNINIALLVNMFAPEFVTTCCTQAFIEIQIEPLTSSDDVSWRARPAGGCWGTRRATPPAGIWCGACCIWSWARCRLPPVVGWFRALTNMLCAKKWPKGITYTINFNNVKSHAIENLHHRIQKYRALQLQWRWLMWHNKDESFAYENGITNVFALSETLGNRS